MLEPLDLSVLTEEERKAVNELNMTTMCGWDKEANLLAQSLIATRKENAELKAEIEELKTALDEGAGRE